MKDGDKIEGNQANAIAGYTEDRLRELRQAARPLMEFLELHHNPHVRAIVDSHSVEVIEGIANVFRDDEDEQTLLILTDNDFIGEGRTLSDLKREASGKVAHYDVVQYGNTLLKNRYGNVTASIDPGEGYRLLDPKSDLRMEGDEYWDSIKWVKATWVGAPTSLCGSLKYRRKLPPKAKVGDWVVYKGWAPKKIVRVNERGAEWCEGHAGGLLPHGEYTIVAPPEIASVGDWVQFQNHAPRKVQSSVHDKVFVDAGSVKLTYEHGSYRIVKRIVKRWSFEDACVAIACDGLSIVRPDGEHAEIKEIRNNGICLKFSHFVSFETLVAMGYTHPNGDPCGIVHWGTVE